MFENAVTLNKQDHRDLHYVPGQPYSFAQGYNAAPVVSGEIKELAREYVLVFGKGEEGLPQVLLGPDKGVNAYVTPEGRWQARIVPAHFRRYPFIAATQKGNEEQESDPDTVRFTIMIEPDAPHLSRGQGKPLFTETGEPAEVLQQVQSALKTLQGDFVRTQRQVKQLDEHGLLVDQRLEIKPDKGEAKALAGFRVIDQEKLNALSGDDLKALHDSGALMLVHAHLISLTNLRDGLLAKRARQTQGATAPQADAPIESDDTFDFSF